MIDRIITYSVRNRWLVIAAGLVLALAGIFAVYHTPVDAIPDLSENQVIVFTDWPGHSPREIEEHVTLPLSLKLQGLAGVRVVRSSSDVQFSMISVIFEDAVDVPTARRRVAERLAELGGGGTSLPAGVSPRLAPDAAATGQIYWYTVEGGGLDPGRLRALQDWYVRPQLSSVPGVAEVASVGGMAIEYQVELDPGRLQARGVSASEVIAAVSRANAAVGGDVIHKANAEFVVRGAGQLGARPDQADGAFEPRLVLRDLENVVVQGPAGPVRVGDVASVSVGAGPRRGVLEKDGNEVTGGVVLMRHGENPLEVTRRLKHKIEEVQTGLPAGVRIISFYDRTPLIEGAIATVTGTLVEAIVTATLCVLLVLLHFRTSFVIALTLPLSVLGSFVLMWGLRRLGIADIQTNIMSLAGLAISIGVLVDSSIVMAENVMHHLKDHFGERKVSGDIRALVLPACLTVGRPIFFSILIMLLSFLPVFALGGGMADKMFRPLAFTKSFALLTVGALAITLVPALCTVFIKGRLRRDTDSWLVRSVAQVYRPVLNWFLDHPAPLAWFLGITCLVACILLGSRPFMLLTLAVALLGCWALRGNTQTPNDQTPKQNTQTPNDQTPKKFSLGVWSLGNWVFSAGVWSLGIWAFPLSLVLVALAAEQNLQPLAHENRFITPLDEGMTMDMPTTWPRASVAQAVDDLKARDMILCRFPEVDMVVGKAGRAETATDPAPIDMIETMVNFRPQEFWPRRKLRSADAERLAALALAELVRRGLVEPPPAGVAVAGAPYLNPAVMEALPLFDAQMREFAFQRTRAFERELGRQLVHFTVDRVVAMLRDNGSLRPEFLAANSTLGVATALVAGHAEHMAMSPEQADVTLLARDIVQKLTRQGALTEGADPFRDTPGLLTEGVRAVHAAFGGTPGTFFSRLHDAVLARYRSLYRAHIDRLDGELLDWGAAVWTRIILEELLLEAPARDPAIVSALRELKRRRSEPPLLANHEQHQADAAGHHHHGAPAPLDLEPIPAMTGVQADLTRDFGRRLLLWRKDRADVAGFGGELDRVMQMPGWNNEWTMPIQNRVDMLYTGVSSTIGIRVLGQRLDDVVRVSGEVAAAVRRVSGAVNVATDPIRGKAYLEIHPDSEKAARRGVSVGDVNDLIEVALEGKVVTTTVEGRERHPVRVRYPRTWREDEETVGSLLVSVRPGNGAEPAQSRQVPLRDVAAIRVVEGPPAIKSENGLLRNYVHLDVRGRDAAAFVEEAQRVVAGQVPLPPGVRLEWTGQFEHEARSTRTLVFVVPVVIVLIFLILYLTYRDWADALLMLLAVPGALAGGVLFQWLFGYPLSVTGLIGYIACFGMATSTGIIMLVYLREAVTRAGGLEGMTLAQLRQAVMDGAVQRLRPKLLTEGTMLLGLAPLLWATGTGAEVIKPMVLPVLGGILFADEVIDLFLPVLFYRVRHWRWQRLHPAQ